MIPETAKASPPIAVAAAELYGVTLNDVVLLATLVWTVVLIVSKLPKAVHAVMLLVRYVKSGGKEGLNSIPETGNGDLHG